MLTQLKTDFPNMYLVAMRGDARVRIGPSHGLTDTELTSSEGQFDELIVLEDFAELREIAGNPKRKAKGANNVPAPMNQSKEAKEA